jgi:hypothetical protein
MQVCEKETMVRIAKDFGKILLGIIVAIAVMGGFQSDDYDEDSDFELTVTYDCRAVMADRVNRYSAETKEECQTLLNGQSR